MTNQRLLKIGAAIIAGGKSTRYDGQNKALLNVMGETILDTNIRILSPLFDEIHIISNTATDFSYTGLAVFADIFENIGPLGGIYTALLHSNYEAVFVFSCDMPFLSANMIMNITTHFINTDSQILIPQMLDKIEPLHAIYSTSVLTSLENHIKTTADYKIRLFFPKVSTSYLSVENTAENQKNFLNINSAEDYQFIITSF